MRRQPPAHSPIALTAIGRSAGALFPPGGRRAEAALSARLQGRHAATASLLVDSGTSALRLAIAAAAGDARPRVALPGFGCYDLVSAAVGAGAEIVFYDVDPETLTPDAASLHRALELRPHAVVLAHLYGVPVSCARFEPAIREAGAVPIEDAAQGVGGTVDGAPLGSLAPLSILSFGRGKGITGGGGGALLARGSGVALLERVRGFVEPGETGVRNLALSAAQWLLGRPALFGVVAAVPGLRIGETIYRPPTPPRRIARASAALVLQALAAEPGASATRRRNAARLLRGVRRNGALAEIEIAPRAEAGYLRLPVLARQGRTRGALLAHARLGLIEGYPIVLPDLPEARPHVVGVGELPGARSLAERLLTAPTHGQLTPPDLLALENLLATAGSEAYRASPTAAATAAAAPGGGQGRETSSS